MKPGQLFVVLTAALGVAVLLLGLYWGTDTANALNQLRSPYAFNIGLFLMLVPWFVRRVYCWYNDPTAID